MRIRCEQCNWTGHTDQTKLRATTTRVDRFVVEEFVEHCPRCDENRYLRPLAARAPDPAAAPLSA